MSLTSYRVNEETASANVKKVPGGVYLCQHNSLTCGACCGMYNFNFSSKREFKKIILERSIVFEDISRDMDSVIEFGEKESLRIDNLGKKPYPDFHHCPYVGFFGDNYEKTGCLIHPLAEKNKGIDLRGLSYYGGLACASYFCPTYYNTLGERKLIVRSCIEDSFTFGLVITESDMINNVFDLLEKITKKPALLQAFDFEAAKIMESLLKIKFNWPFKRKSFYPANYFFKDTDQKDEIDPVCQSSEYYHILKAVKADIRSKIELAQAEDYIFSKINELAAALK